MGISWSNNNNNNRRRNTPNYYQTPYPSSQYISSPSSSSSSYCYPLDPYPAPYPYPAHPPPPPPATPIYSSYYSSGGYNACNYTSPVMGMSSFGPYYSYGYQDNGWVGIPAAPMAVTAEAVAALPPPAYVEHQEAKKVKNDVNVHKDTIRLVRDEAYPDHHLVSFVFDAMFDGSITIFYFAKEEANCKIVPVCPESYLPIKIPFQKGLGQRFFQPSGTGINLGYFKLADLSKPWPAEDVYPLVICAETCLPSFPMDIYFSDHCPNTSSHLQITQAVLEKNNGDPFKLRVIKQILWIDEVRYELREIFGLGNSAESFNDNDSGKECVVCMTEPRDTAVLPCRHMCMCSECSKALRLQSNKCPICRQPIEELMEIKIY
ncbi:hypothetical protein ACET3Z_032516 [Daucus carota]